MLHRDDFIKRFVSREKWKSTFRCECKAARGFNQFVERKWIIHAGLSNWFMRMLMNKKKRTREFSWMWVVSGTVERKVTNELFRERIIKAFRFHRYEYNIWTYIPVCFFGVICNYSFSLTRGSESLVIHKCGAKHGCCSLHFDSHGARHTMWNVWINRVR